MKNVVRIVGIAGLLLWGATSASAGKPNYVDPYTQTLVYLGNGYPSGAHFNLNVLGKSPDYQCTTPPPVDGTYGNVIFIPDNGQKVQILMESGAKGPKSQPTTTVLEVTDACAGFGPNDSATLRLPARAEGYAVFARASGKPSEGATIRIFDPAITYVAAYDANTDPMFYLGVVSGDGVFSSSQETFERLSGGRTAKDITGLFTWSGMVCYPFGLPAGYTETSGYTFTQQCCSLNDTNGDGVPDQVGTCGLEVMDSTGVATCGTGWLPCVDYAAETWVFNIADIVDYVWSVENSGVKNLQVRFYPLPLETQPWVQGAK